MQGFKACRLAELVGGAKHVDAIADTLDGNTAAGKTFDIEQAQCRDLHGAIACV
ncbi:hypothetical protein ACU8OH_35740 (plasmid) [Rhizobium leguminosarum]